jgi:hypothetical protein
VRTVKCLSNVVSANSVAPSIWMEGSATVSAAGDRRFVIEEILTCVRARRKVRTVTWETLEEGKRVRDFVFLNPEDGTDSLSRNVSKKSLRNNPEECSSQLLRGGNLKSLILQKLFTKYLTETSRYWLWQLYETHTSTVKDNVEFLIVKCGMYCYYHTVTLSWPAGHICPTFKESF